MVNCKFRLLRFLVVASSLMVAENAAADVEFTVSTGSNHFVESALNATYESFFGSPPSQSVLARPARWAVAGAGTGTDITLSWAKKLPYLGSNIDSLVSLSYGQRRLKLENGFGIFTDPAKVRMNVVTAKASVGLHQIHPLSPRLQLETRQHLGVISSLSDTHLTSALLDVRSRDVATSPFLMFRFGMHHNSLKAEATLFVLDQGRLDITLGTGFKF